MAAQDSVAACVRRAGRALAADRCWLYARDPAAGAGVALVRWLRAPGVPDVPEAVRRWSTEPPDLAARDPLFARALAGIPLDAVDDAAAAPVDAELERALGHRAFVHLNLHVDGVLWGVLQPGMTSAPRAWTATECAQLLGLRPVLAPLVAAVGREPSRLLVG
jgi:GAF domain-containing protein